MIQRATHVEFGKRDQTTDNINAALINRLHASSRAHSSNRPLHIGLTSCEHGEGVSTCAMNLARYCAEVLKMESILIDVSPGSTDASLRTNGLTPGLRQVLSKDADLTSTIQKSEVTHLDFLPGGSGSQHPFPAVSVAEFPNMLNKLDLQYEMVIVDLPPIGGIVSGIPIANKLDGVVIVVCPGTTKKERAKSVSHYLRQSGVNVVGALANRAQTELPPFTTLVTEIATDVISVPLSFLRFAVNRCLRRD